MDTRLLLEENFGWQDGPPPGDGLWFVEVDGYVTVVSLTPTTDLRWESVDRHAPALLPDHVEWLVHEIKSLRKKTVRTLHAAGIPVSMAQKIVEDF